jgi:hypothetical protein
MENPDMEKQQAVLGWMQILCHLGVTIPLDILFNMFTTGQDQSCGSGSGAFLTPGSGVGKKSGSGSGIWIRD